MANIKIELSSNEVQAALRTLPALRKLDRPQGLYKIWATYLERLVVRSFQAQQQPLTNKGWAPLRPITRQLRNNKGKGILRNTGALYDTISGRVLPDGASVGTNQMVGIYSLGAIHQFGAVVPITLKSRAFFRHKFRTTKNQGWDNLRRVKSEAVIIPARPFLPMDEDGSPLPQLTQELGVLTRDWLLR
ncbi:MAG: phage virion morphogenesis protein [Leptolyngbyaceae cyanobacterium]